MASYKANQANKAKKQAAAKQKEAQKREADSLKRAHLAGLRVVQKNLVYVTGLSPKVQEQQLLETLRGDQYFGQYGKIVKIVVSKAKQAANPPHSVGVYVTFERKEDAQTCIQAVDGSQNGDRTLRAQYGTTKYCSAYLRGDNCGNRNCMFLHEAAEDNESFTRHDLSAMNATSSQRPAQAAASSRTAQIQPPPPQSQQPMSAASQPMQRESSGDGVASPTGSTADGPALPSTASWGNRALQTSRRASLATASSNASPKVTKAEPSSQPEAARSAAKTTEPSTSSTEPRPATTSKTHASNKPAVKRPPKSPFDNLIKAINSPDFEFRFAATGLSDEELNIITNFPPLFDPNGGAKRRQIKEQDAERRRQEADAQLAAQTAAAATAEAEEAPEAVSGSLQLGGEPEERTGVGLGQQHSSMQQPSQLGSHLGPGGLADEVAGLNLGRGLTPQQQQQQYQLQQLKSINPQSASLLGALQQPGYQQGGPSSGHARNQSRFTFANDSSSASTSVKPVANAKLMSQQSSMMPQQASHFSQMSNQPGQFFNSGVTGPPPGLKQSGTPPMTGPQRFGHGIGFGDNNRLGYGAGGQEALLRDMMQGQRGGAGQASDAQKREYHLSSLLHHHHQPPHQSFPSNSSTPASVGGHAPLGFPYGGGGGG
ncbi:MAG: hypothetical protein INR71_05995, partial [Terriglobus roseus]|nr:hypothetical protein [Terriglobus roseus]